MATWSSTIISEKGVFVDGQDGESGRPAKKSFSFPGKTTSIPIEPGYGSTARKVTVVISDDVADPNFFDVDFEFEFESNVKDHNNEGFAVCGKLWEDGPDVDLQKQAVAEFELNWPRDCGLQLGRLKIKHVRAVRYSAAKRSNYAWFYLIAYNRSVKFCPKINP
jgi:hypothetical protein